MDSNRFQKAAHYAIELMQRKMLPVFTYHNMNHTLEVADACTRLAELERVDEENQRLLLIAAYFHDTGLTAISRIDLDTYTAERAVHEEKAVQIARDILPTFGFTKKEIETIARLIMATKRGHSPVDVLEQIIADADISSIGQATSSFMRSNQALLKELRSFGIQIKDAEWYKDQKEFMETHTYHTPAARSLFERNRRLNMAVIRSHINT